MTPTALHELSDIICRMYTPAHPILLQKEVPGCYQIPGLQRKGGMAHAQDMYVDAQQASLQRAVEALPLLPDAIVLLKVSAALACKISLGVAYSFFYIGILLSSQIFGAHRESISKGGLFY